MVGVSNERWRRHSASRFAVSACINVLHVIVAISCCAVKVDDRPGDKKLEPEENALQLKILKEMFSYLGGNGIQDNKPFRYSACKITSGQLPIVFWAREGISHFESPKSRGIGRLTMN